MLTKRYSNQV